MYIMDFLIFLKYMRPREEHRLRVVDHKDIPMSFECVCMCVRVYIYCIYIMHGLYVGTPTI